MPSLRRLNIRHLIGSCSLYWLITSQLFGTRASLPPESLQVQSFESYPDKKGGWYSDHVSSYQIKASAHAAFRGQYGVELSGKADGDLLMFRLPLNPQNGGTRPIKHLKAHRGRFLLRSNCRGVVRYVLRTKGDLRIYSPWVAFQASPSNSFNADNPEPYLTQTWSAHWQQIELPNYKPSEHDYKTEAGQALSTQEEVEPEALDFRCRGDVGSFELHVDEFSIDIDHLMNHRNKAYQKMPLMNVAKAFPRPSSLFASPFYFNISEPKNEADSTFEWQTNAFEETELQWKGSKALDIQPRRPLHIASDCGVRGLRLGLRSSGTRDWKLKLVFSEEKQRQSQDGREPHETFATYLPLDFKGLRHFEIPLSFTGLPLRPNYRLHNKKIDGSLKLETLKLEPLSDKTSFDPIQTHKLSFVALDQWVDQQTWTSKLGAYPSQNFPHTPTYNPSMIQTWPLVIKDMEHLETFNSSYQHNDHTWVDVFDLNKAAATRGRYGLDVKLAPEPKTSPSQNLQATFFFKQTDLSPLNPKGEFQWSLRGRASHTSKVSLWLKDDLGQIFASPFETLSRQHSQTRRRDHKIDWIDFDIANASLKKYRLESKGPRKEPSFPYRPYALQILTPKTSSKVQFHFDDLVAWTPISKPQLWRQQWRRDSPFFVLGKTSTPFSRDLFCSSDAWHVQQTYTSQPDWDTGLVDDQNIMEDLNKAEQGYQQAKEELALVKKLDPQSPKTIDDYFKSYQSAPIEGHAPKLLHFQSHSKGLELSLNWNEQRALKPWERLGASGVSLESALWNAQLDKDKASWIPVADGVKGMVLTLWTSAHLDTSLRVILVDEDNRYFIRHLPLDQKGLFSHRLAFSDESFRILSPSGRRVKNQSIPKKLRLLRVEIEHAPLTPEHAGVQHLKFYPLQWLIERKKSSTAFKN